MVAVIGTCATVRTLNSLSTVYFFLTPSTGNILSELSAGHYCYDPPSSMGPLVLISRTDHDVSFPGLGFIFHQCHPPRALPRSRLRNRRLYCIQSIHLIHGRVVRQPTRTRVRHNLGWIRGIRDNIPNWPREAIGSVRIRNYSQGHLRGSIPSCCAIHILPPTTSPG